MIKKADILMILAVLLLAAGIWIAFALRPAGAQTVSVTVDGKPYGTYSLAENQEIEINQNGERNILIIKNGGVHMAQSNCPGGQCLAQGEIRDGGASIVCLPHRIYVELSGNSEYDAIVS